MIEPPSEANLRQMKVAELKHELSSLELSITVKKEELLNRLLEHLYPGSPPCSEVQSGSTTPNPLSKNEEEEEEDEEEVDDKESSSTINTNSSSSSIKLDSSKCQNILDAQKIKERQARFGIVSPISTPSISSISTNNLSKSPQLPKGLSAAELEFEAKKAARLARFGAV